MWALVQSAASRGATRFLAVAFLGVVVSFAVWPAVQPVYAFWFRTFGNLAMVVLFWDPVRFEESGFSFTLDTIVYVDGCVDGWFVEFSSEALGYRPTIIFLALLGATHAVRLARRHGLAVGLLTIHAYIACRMLLGLLFGLTVHAKRCDGGVGSHDGLISEGLWRSALENVIAILHVSPTVTALVPLLTWVLVALDWATVRVRLDGHRYGVRVRQSSVQEPFAAGGASRLRQ